MVCSFVQAQAAAQAGVSVIQPNVGRIMDWYKKHPGYIKNLRVSHRPKFWQDCHLASIYVSASSAPSIDAVYVVLLLLLASFSGWLTSYILVLPFSFTEQCKRAC